jgi:hypothetical protein
MTYELAILVDFLIISACGYLLVRYNRLSISHPATIYIIFHVYAFSARIVALAFGAPPLFSREEWINIYVEEMHPQELIRAMLYADLALFMMTVGWTVARTHHMERKRRSPIRGRLLRENVVKTVAWVCAPFAMFGFLAQTMFPGIGQSSIQDALSEGVTQSGYYQILQTWPCLILLALIYLYGFRREYMIPMVAYLLIVGFQGYHRFRVIIPVLLMIQMYLGRLGRKWPNFTMSLLLVAGIFLSLSLKLAGKALQTGASVNEVVELTLHNSENALQGRADDQNFLDQYAACLSLVDEQDHLAWGQPYLALITLPIPRYWWPEKPSTGDYIHQLSTRQRPMGENGMIVTFLGEAYANFGILGLILIPAILAYALGRAHLAAEDRPFRSLGRFSYLLIACNLVQVYRDGLVSLVVFTFVNMMPLMIIIILHMLLLRPSLLDGTERENNLNVSGSRLPAWSRG